MYTELEDGRVRFVGLNIFDVFEYFNSRRAVAMSGVIDKLKLQKRYQAESKERCKAAIPCQMQRFSTCAANCAPFERRRLWSTIRELNGGKHS